MPLSSPPEHRARIAWVSNHGGPEPLFRKAFREACYGVSGLKDERFADVAIVDFRKSVVSAKAARKLAASARRSAPHGGVIYLADPYLDAARRAYLRRSGTLVLTTDDPAPLIEACRERIRTRNLTEEAGERVKSLAEAGALKPIKEPDGQKAPFHILVAGKPSPLTLSVLSIARSAGHYVEGVLSPSQAMNAIETGRFDCAIFLPSTPSDPLWSLSRTLKRRSRQTDFPVLLVNDQEAASGNIVPASQIEDDLADHIASGIRRAGQARLIRAFLSPDAYRNVADNQTQTVSASFFARHGARLIARAKETERAVSLIAISINAGVLENASASEIAAPLSDIATLIASISRTEDMLARIAPTTFIMTLPATIQEDSDRIANRLSGVLQNTMFKLRDQATGEDMLFAVSVTTATMRSVDELRLEEITAQLLSTIKTQPITSKAHS